jgi:hypothetical protein
LGFRRVVIRLQVQGGRKNVDCHQMDCTGLRVSCVGMLGGVLIMRAVMLKL